MTVTKQTTLKCNNCGKTVSFVGERPEQSGPLYIEGEPCFFPPKNWYRLEPNHQQSLWPTTDFSVSGDFCSPECIRDYLIKKIDERDNPKISTMFFTGGELMSRWVSGDGE